MKKLFTLALVLCLALSMAAPAMAETEQKIIYQMSNEPQYMDPTLNEFEEGAQVHMNLFRGLYKFDQSNNLVPAMAEGYTLSEDETVYTFTLRDGLVWSDGSPLTAYDFEFTYKRIADPANASATCYELYCIKNVEKLFNGLDDSLTLDDVGVKALDEKTLEITLEAPTPWFISLTASSAFLPVCQAALEKYGEDWVKSPETYVCNGPFMPKEFYPNEKFVMVKNPNYYEADNVKLETLEYVFLNAAETALLAYENGEIDVLYDVNADAEARYAGTPDMFSQGKIGMRFYHMNCKSEALQDPRVRQALTISIDRKILVENVLQSDYEPLYGYIPHAFPDIVEPEKSWREVNGNVFEEDVERAKELLAEAGYPNGEGLPTIRLCSTPTASLVKVAQAMQAMWKQNLGIDVEVVTYETGVYWTKVNDESDFDIAYTGNTGSYLDPLSLLVNFTTAKCYENGSDCDNEVYDGYVAQLQAGISGEEREEVLRLAEQELFNTCPILPVYSYTTLRLVKPYVKGFQVNYGGHANFEYAYVEK